MRIRREVAEPVVRTGHWVLLGISKSIQHQAHVGHMHEGGRHCALARLLVILLAVLCGGNMAGCGGAGAPAGAAAVPPSGRRRQQGGAGGSAVGRCKRRCACAAGPPPPPPRPHTHPGRRPLRFIWSSAWPEGPVTFEMVRDMILQGSICHRLFGPTSSNFLKASSGIRSS